MNDEVRKNLEFAFSGESQAHVRYQFYSEIADKEGMENIARLFKAVSYAERVHAGNHLELLGGMNITKDNLDIAIAGETYEVKKMYPEFLKKANSFAEEDAATANYRALEAEKTHRKIYKKAAEAVKAGSDLAIGKIYICPKCGHAMYDDVPDKCPICDTEKELFMIF